MRLRTWLEFVLAFGVFNATFGVTLLFYYPKLPLVVVSPLIPQVVWSIIFLSSGALAIYGVSRRKFHLLWVLMILGAFIKGMWEAGFIIRYFAGGSLLQVEIWAILTWIQILLVAHFDRRVLT